MTDSVDLGHGIHRLAIPLPFPSPSHVNCYALESDDGITLIDCGVDSPVGREALRLALGALGASPADLGRLVVTHLHVDHMGLSRRLMEEADCDFVMHRLAVDEVDGYNDFGPGLAALAETAARHGAPESAVEMFRVGFPRPDWFGQALPPRTPVTDGDRIPLGGGRHLEVLHTPGHHPTHICLVDSRTGRFFAGDHVLPRISPFVPYLGEDQDSLGDYLAGLERVVQRRLELTQPAHGPEISRGWARARQILLHHQRRFDAITAVLGDGPATAWQVMEAVFRPNLSPFEQRLAFQETLAHLEHLRRREQIERIRHLSTVRYQLAPHTPRRRAAFS